MKALVSLGLLFCASAAPAEPNKHIGEVVVNAGGGVCQESWAKKLQAESSVRLEMQFVDKDGKPVQVPGMEGGMQFCSASLARVGTAKKVKIVSAAHCFETAFRYAADGVDRIPAINSREGRPDRLPAGAEGVRVVAWVGGMGPAIPIKTFKGPDLKGDPKDEKEVFRKNDFAILDAADGVLEQRMAGKTVPELCPPSLKKEDVKKAAVIGYGITNGEQMSTLPLCGQQQVKDISQGIIAIEPYRTGLPGACPGDSGGGLWFVPKTQNAKPCLAGAVSGPRQASVKNAKPPESAVEDCTRDGLEAIYASVYQQQDAVNRYTADQPNSPEPGENRSPANGQRR